MAAPRPAPAAGLLALALSLAAPAAAAADETEVDLELVLAVDVSRSMSVAELEIQRQGYAAALTSAEVQSAIGAGFLGRIAVTYVEWAGETSQRTIVPWTLIDGPEAAQELALRILAMREPTMRRTSISGAIAHGAALFEGNGFTAWRQVIDISGDGPNNQGPPVTAARDAAVARGITINGLPILADDGQDGLGHIPDLDIYYRECVIGGPGAFVVAVRDWADFAAAVRRKLVLEIAGPPATPAPAGNARIVPAQGYDCLVGERQWQRRGYDWQ